MCSVRQKYILEMWAMQQEDMSQSRGKGCQIALHNDSMFSLARCNFLEVLGGEMKERKAPNETAKRQNMQWINKLRGLLMKEDEGNN
jgi:hypothetical protein